MSTSTKLINSSNKTTQYGTFDLSFEQRSTVKEKVKKAVESTQARVSSAVHQVVKAVTQSQVD